MKTTVVGGVAFGGWILTVITILLAPVIFPSEIERFVGHGVPRQYRSDLLSEILADYADVQGVAHNAGNSLATAAEASRHNADIIEVDVVSVNGRLYASHDGPRPIIGSRVFPRPRLERVWDETGDSPLLIDVKEPSAGYRAHLLDFLGTEMGEREVLVSSRSRRTLEEFERSQPAVKRLLSVSSVKGLTNLSEDPDLLSLIDGVSVRHTLLDEETVQWLRSNDLTVFAWVVNEIGRVNELVEWGVDGITTDDLAILDLLGNGLPFDLPENGTDRPPTGGAVLVISLRGPA